MAILGKWAGSFQGGGSDKVWAAWYDSTGLYVAGWGRRGQRLQRKEELLGLGLARQKFVQKMTEKQREGYNTVPFGDSYYAIPDPGPLGLPNAVRPPVAQPPVQIPPVTRATPTSVPTATPAPVVPAPGRRGQRKGAFAPVKPVLITRKRKEW